MRKLINQKEKEKINELERKRGYTGDRNRAKEITFPAHKNNQKQINKKILNLSVINFTHETLKTCEIKRQEMG